MTYIPRRSVLYMPASNPRALEKARHLPADCIILDLEDAVAPAVKSEARCRAIEAIHAGGYGDREVAIRINAVGTRWFEEDLAAVIHCPAHALVLPKVEDHDTVQRVADALPESMALWVMIETPRGVINVEKIVSSHTRLQVLVMGTSDLANELRVPQGADRSGLLYSLSRCVVAARAAGLAIIDGVFLDISDDDGFAASCEQGVSIGFDGKSLIHPGQIETANRIFAPSEEKVRRATRIVELWRDAEASGSGIAVLDGKLIENLHAAEAERTLQIAACIARRNG